MIVPNDEPKESPPLNAVLLPFKYAVRRLAKSPGYVIVSVVLLALGVGMCTSAFSMANVSLLASLPFPDGDRLMRIFGTSPQSQSMYVSPADYLYFRTTASCFLSVSAYNGTLQNIGEPGQTLEAQRGLVVTPNFLTTLGVQPFVGRDFAADEDQPGRGKVVLLKNAYWQRRFSGDPKIIGRTLRVGGDSVIVIGILPPVFDTMGKWGGTMFFRPMTMAPNSPTLRNRRSYNVIGRLKSGISVRTARTEMSVLATRLDHDYPAEEGNSGVRLTPLKSSDISDSTRKWYWLTTGMASLVLLIACANLASLQLARAFGRSQEFAIRTALGARRVNLMAPLLAESSLLAVTGGGLGVLVAYWANRVMSRLFWDNLPIPLDGRVLAFALIASLATGLVFGLAPAWLVSRVSTGDALKELSRGSTSGRAHKRFKFSMVAGQVALALVLISAALSFGVGVKNSLKSVLDWQPEDFLSGWISNLANYNTDAKKHILVRDLHEKLGQIPGVTAVSISTEQPFYGFFISSSNIVIEGMDGSPKKLEQEVGTVAFERGMFSILKMRLLDGRSFPDQSLAANPGMIIINEAMGRQFWPGQSAIGKRVRFGDNPEWSEVIGIVGDIRISPDLASPISHLQIYRSVDQVTSSAYSILLKSTMPPDSLIAPVRKVIGEIDPTITVTELGGVENSIRAKVADASSEKIVSLSAFAFIGLLIALIGIYGVISQLTIQRNREIGIRIALGADNFAVVRLILSQGVRLLLCGVTFGLIGVYGVGRFYEMTMPGLQLPGAGLQVAIASLLCLAGLAASYLPARRASRIDPVVALRSE